MRSFSACVPSALLALALVTAATTAVAEDATRAQALFDEGRRLMTDGKYGEACPKLAASQKLDPGAGTLMNLATCYDKNGQAASAWATFKEAATAARASGHTDWETAARGRASELEPDLPRLTILVRPEAQAPGLVVERDGQPLDPAEWGAALPVDAGKHTIRAAAPGRAAWTSDVTVAGPRPVQQVTVPALAVEAAPTEPPKTAPPAAPPEADRGSSDGSGQRVVGLVLGGAGVVAVGLGAFFGLKAKSSHDDALAHCNASHQCDAEGLSRDDDAHTQATVATIAFVAAGALLAGGAAIFFTAPRPAAAAARVRILPTGPGLAGLSLGGAF